MVKNLKKLGIERVYFSTVEAIYNKHTGNITMNGEKLKPLL
jgi:hypothetical protein